MDLMERAGELKGELVDYALSERFSGALRSLILDSFPDGVVNDEAMLTCVIEDFLFHHRLAGGDRVVEKFVADRTDLGDEDKALVLGWRDNVQGMFEIGESYGEDAVIAFNHVDELTSRVRSNMGSDGIEALARGMIMVGYRNPEKLAQARRVQEQQREAFIDLHGSDLIVVPGAQVQPTMMAFYRYIHEQEGNKNGPWTEPELEPLPTEWATADSVAIIYDSEDGLGFYIDFALAQQAFADPKLVRRRRYREPVSGYLREESSPVPILRLAESNPDGADRVFQQLLNKPRFSWERDGQALLRRYKADWYAEPPPPCVPPIAPELGQRFCDAKN